MTRAALAGCMALAALAAGAVLDVGTPTADAAPSVSPFAGTYVGADPEGWYGAWDVTISDGGQISSSKSISGRVAADGAYSFTVSLTVPTMDNPERRSPGPQWRTISYKSTGTMALDGAGDIVGTASTGKTFLWLRR